MPSDSLQSRLEALRSMLDRPSAGAAGAQHGAGGDAIRVLMEDVERKAGIQVGDSVRSKLARLAASKPPHEVSDWAARVRGLDARHPEWLALVEELTVNETYFFRDAAQLGLLRESVLPGLLAAARAQARPCLRVWSAGCSTGEEAHTVAMLILDALLEAGEATEGAGGVRPHARWTLQVLGTDLSRPALRRAGEAVYQRTPMLGSFRGVPERFMRFFTPMDGGAGGGLYRVREDVRRLAEFRQYNLMEPAPAIVEADVVLCRNVLIYFGKEARAQVQRRLRDALRRDGYLILGPSEVIEEPAAFRPIWGPSAIVYQRR